MAALTLQEADKAGGVTLVAAESGGDTFETRPGAFVVVLNQDASPHTVTIAAVNDPLSTIEAGSLPVADIEVVVTADTVEVFSVPSAYQTAGGNVAMTYDDVTSVTIAVGYVTK